MTKVGYKSFCLHHLSLNMSNYNSLLLYLDKSLGQCQSFGCVELEMSENIWTNCLSDWQIWLSKRRSSELADISFDWWAFSQSGLVLFLLSYQLCNLIIFSATKIMSTPSQHRSQCIYRDRAVFSELGLKCVCHNVSQPRTDDWHFMFNWNKIL